MADTAPLLDDINSIEGDTLLVTNRVTRRIHKLFKILRVFTLLFSTLTLILIISNYIILGIAPFWDPYRQREVNDAVIGWIIAALVASLINLLVNIPVLINTVSDTTFAVGTIISMVRWIGRMPFDDCYIRYDWRDRTKPIPVNPSCKEWRLGLNVIMGFTAAFGILLAASYVCMLLLRVYELLKIKFWKKSSWSVPVGQVTWTISMNIVTDGNARTYGITAGAKSDPGEAHGAVHL